MFTPNLYLTTESCLCLSMGRRITSQQSEEILQNGSDGFLSVQFLMWEFNDTGTFKEKL